ncbi:MAG: hypothetical protein PHT50_01205 [Candidatus Omnitrophica bacterium]|nr:hypothetical protein [Candidatus Omnitrophota bacterium]
MQRKVILVARLLLFVFCAAGVYLWVSNLRLKASLKKVLKTKVVKQGVELQQHKKLKEDLKKGLEEKYRADMISYQVVTKRLEQEQNKEKGLREGEKQTQKFKQGPGKGGGR